MTRRIVFAGGVQARALAKAYRHDIAYDRDDDIFFIGTEALERPAAHRAIASADTVITEVNEAGDVVPAHLITDGARRIGVPLVLGDFLWPYSARPHPRNQGTKAVPDGPYPAGFGDSYLDELLAAGISGNEAVSRYLATDLAREIDLDALLAARLERQARLDAATGFDIAGFIDAEFRRQHLFATLDRPHLALLRHLGATLCDRLGEPAGSAEAIADGWLPAGAMPIHPSVLRHFGMREPTPDHRYPLLDEGLFTFEQYCRRYVLYAWNERLHDAIALAENDPAAAIPMLRDALDASPGSRAGQNALEAAERAVRDSTMLPPLALPPPDRASEHAPWRSPLEFGDQKFGDLAYGLNPRGPDTAPAPVAFTNFASITHEATKLADPPPPPEPQSYVELPQGFAGYTEPRADRVPSTPTERYTPLAPAKELIEVLPRMLSANRSLAGVADSPFAAMPETMPPPPLRPVLPPELAPEPARRGLVGRLFGGRQTR